jgi:hypothetical protein
MIHIVRPLTLAQRIPIHSFASNPPAPPHHTGRRTLHDGRPTQHVAAATSPGTWSCWAFPTIAFEAEQFGELCEFEWWGWPLCGAGD